MHELKEFKGRVKCVKQYTSYAYYGVLGKYYLSNEYRFDERGNQTYYFWFNWGEKSDSYRNVICTSQYEYDSHGNMIRELMENSYFGKLTDWRFNYDANDRLISKYMNGTLLSTSSYDENGLLTERCFYENDCVRYQITYLYDQDGRLIEKIDGDKMQKTTYQYDEQGRQITSSVFRFDPSKRKVGVVKQKFDDGYITATSEHQVEEAWVLASIESIRYDENGKKKETWLFDAKTNQWSVCCNYVYGDSGRLAEEQFLKSEERTVYHYDEKENIVEKIYYKKGNKIESNSYDGYGNIIESKNYENNVITSAYKSEFEYYED